MKNLTWNVYVISFNDKKIEEFNVFEHGAFREAVNNVTKKYKKELKKEDLTVKAKNALLKDFEESIKKELMYYFWSKYEWEIGVTEPFSNLLIDDHTKGRKYPWEKIDVYDQVMINWGRFFEYICNSLLVK